MFREISGNKFQTITVILHEYAHNYFESICCNMRRPDLFRNSPNTTLELERALQAQRVAQVLSEREISTSNATTGKGP